MRRLDALDRGRTAPPTASDQTAQTSRTSADRLHAHRDRSRGRRAHLRDHIAAAARHALRHSADRHVHRGDAGFIGNDSFTFTASDAFSTSNTGDRVDRRQRRAARRRFSRTRRPSASPSRCSSTCSPTTRRAPGRSTPATLTVASAPTRGTAVVETGKIRYTPTRRDRRHRHVLLHRVRHRRRRAERPSSPSPSPRTTRRPPPPTATTSAAGTTLHPAAPGVLANDSDPDAGDRMQARLVTRRDERNAAAEQHRCVHLHAERPRHRHVRVPRGRLLGRGVERRHGHDRRHRSARPADRRQRPVRGAARTRARRRRAGRARRTTPARTRVSASRCCSSATPPRARCCCIRTARSSTRRRAGYTGIDQFSYVVRDSEGRVSQEAHVGITVTSGGPPTAMVGATSPADGARLTGPTHFTATLVPPGGRDGHLVDRVVPPSRRRDARRNSPPDRARPSPPTSTRRSCATARTAIVIRAVTSGGGVLVNETGVIVEGDYKPGRYATTVSRRRRQLRRTSRSICCAPTTAPTRPPATSASAGACSSRNFRVDTNGPLGGGGWSTFTCGSLPVPRHVLHVVRSRTSSPSPGPTGTLERFRFAPNQGSQLVPTHHDRRVRRRAGHDVDPRRRRRRPAAQRLATSCSATSSAPTASTTRSSSCSPTSPAPSTASTGAPACSASPTATATRVEHRQRRRRLLVGDVDDVRPRRRQPHHADRRARREHRLQLLAGRRSRRRRRIPNGTSQAFTYDAQHNLLTTSGGGQVVRTLHYDASGRRHRDHRRQRQHDDDRQRRRRPPAGRHRRHRHS